MENSAFTKDEPNEEKDQSRTSGVDLKDITVNGIEKSRDDKTENVIIEQDEKLFEYDVHDNPPIYLTIGFAMQQVLMSLSRSLSTSLLVADIVCARTDENFKARLLSTTLLLSGVTTLLQNVIGIRLPLYQGPAATYVVPLLAMSSLPEWKCPDTSVSAGNSSSNASVDIQSVIMYNTQRLEGSLMIAGAFHMFMGLTGAVGLLLRFIGPVTVIPALTITGLYVYRATVRFAKAQWGVAMLTVGTAVVLSFYMRRLRTPVPTYSRDRGFHIKWSSFHRMFSVLIACVVGWAVSAILTVAGAFSDDPDSPQVYARTDSRLEVLHQTDWFIMPYPGQFGAPRFEVGAFITFMLGTISSIIDSIGDYYACSKVCSAPPPPAHAVNRGIAVEGAMSFLSGWSGAGHATSTFGGNIGAIGITRVASLRVFQVVGLIYIVFGVLGKLGALFVTVPYSVIGGMMMINFGVLIGVMLSNLQFVDMNSTRNMGIIGISMLVSLMLPHWLETTDNAIDTGVSELDSLFRMLLANPVFISGFLACFMDNTIPGSEAERGMLAWKEDIGQGSREGKEQELSTKETQRQKKLLKTIYTVPFVGRIKALRYLPFCPR